MKKILSIIALLIICSSTLIFRAWAEENGPAWIKDTDGLKVSIDAPIGLIVSVCVSCIVFNLITHFSSQMPVEGDHLKKCGGCQIKKDNSNRT